MAPGPHPASAEPAERRLGLTLFVADRSAASIRARRQLDAWIAQRGEQGIDLTVIDVLDEPDAAEAERILATPALIRHSPPPRRKVVGDLSDWERVAIALDLDEAP